MHVPTLPSVHPHARLHPHLCTAHTHTTPHLHTCTHTHTLTSTLEPLSDNAPEERPTVAAERRSVVSVNFEAMGQVDAKPLYITCQVVRVLHRTQAQESTSCLWPAITSQYTDTMHGVPDILVFHSLMSSVVYA